MKIGILGGGQLARMLALAGLPLGCEFAIFSPDRQSCAAPLGRQMRADYDDEVALSRLAAWSDVITFEFENIPAQALQFLTRHAVVRPGVEALRLAQDRLLEKQLFTQLGIPCAPFQPADSLADLHQAAQSVGLPAVLKTRRQGYDGRGQVVLHHIDEFAPAWQLLGGQPAILEGLVAFDRELSVFAVRAVTGETIFYSISENIHHDGILRLAVSRPDDPAQKQAEQHADRLLKHLDYVGVLALEFFQVGDQLLANEYAPRVHNSGHWTIEGAATSQFENHLRAITGLSLGSTALNGVAATINLIGSIPDNTEILRNYNAHLHLYGKTCKPGRKVGHITLCADSMQQLQLQLPGLLRLAGAGDVCVKVDSGHHKKSNTGGDA
jgi:5-(carboxyamino)imidazole ribonucleotide synthase